MYMIQASYTADSWATQISNPEDRAAAIGGMIDAAGGKMHGFYYSFGEYDALIIGEAPDNQTMAGILIAAAGGGAVSKLKTTVLMSAEEGLASIRAAGSVGYRPPGG